MAGLGPQISVYMISNNQIVCSSDSVSRQCRSTLEPLNIGHFGSRSFVLDSEVVHW